VPTIRLQSRKRRIFPPPRTRGCRAPLIIGRAAANVYVPRGALTAGGAA
jgi:hypothetical protein